MVIWKYEIDESVNRIDLPVGAKILRVGEQHGSLRIWALVNPNVPKVTREFYIVGTGQIFYHRRDDVHLGTVVMPGGIFVWHVFERARAAGEGGDAT